MEDTVGGAALIALGGFVGAVARYGVDVAVLALGAPAATGTLTVNVVGTFALGVLVTRAADQKTQLLVGTGGISSFTTYSTFAAEAVTLGTAWGALYVVGSYAFGFAAGVIGLSIGRRVR